MTTTTLATLSRLLDLSPDALVVIDQQGIVVLANPQASTLFGYASDHLLGHPLEQLLPERLRAQHVAHRAEYFSAPHSRPMGIGLDLVGRRRDGAEFPIDISLRPYRIKHEFYAMAAIRDVSAQRQWERERAELVARLRLQTDLINLAHDAILVRDPANRILVWNKGAEDLYGWTAQEALGRVTHTLFKTRFPIGPRRHPGPTQRDGAWEGELAHTRPDGRVVIVESRQVLVRDATGQPSAILEINRDITERRQLEETEATTQANTLVQLSFLQQLLDALPNGIYVVHGRDARLVLANRAATSTWGAVWAPEQPMQEFFETHQIHLTDAQGRPLAPDAWATIRALRQGETSLQLQEVIYRPKGDALPILVNAVPLAFSYWQSLEMGGSLTDASPGAGAHHDARIREQAESERRATGERTTGEPLALVIQQDVRVLKEAEYVKDEFIGLAAHELRTPVAALKGAIGTLLYQTKQGHGPALAEWQEEMLQDLDLATDRLTGLTDALLDVTRLQAGLVALHRTPTDLVALVKRVVERMQTATTHHHLEVAIVTTTGEHATKGGKEQRSQHAKDLRRRGHRQSLTPPVSSRSSPTSSPMPSSTARTVDPSRSRSHAEPSQHPGIPASQASQASRHPRHPRHPRSWQ